MYNIKVFQLLNPKLFIYINKMNFILKYKFFLHFKLFFPY